jgi:hypothetical protein
MFQTGPQHHRARTEASTLCGLQENQVDIGLERKKRKNGKTFFKKGSHSIRKTTLYANNSVEDAVAAAGHSARASYYQEQ